jgi:fructose-1,6-bisphosphatase I
MSNPLKKLITLDEFIIRNEKDFPFASGELSGLLRDIGLAAKIVNREVNKAGLVTDIQGIMGSTNSSGEEQKKLDVYANDMFINALRVSGECCGVATEENDDYIAFEPLPGKNVKYIVNLDPLDGSGNIDVNVSIGTIFSIFRRVSLSGPCTREDFLQKGREQVAAGYIIYGSSTMLVYTTGNGVNGFTLDPSIGEFCLSHPNFKFPPKGKIYSVNQGNFLKFPEPIRRYIDYCTAEDKATGRPYSFRYIGSMVADFHRNMIQGGIYMYPPTTKQAKGKLRLLFECNPLAFIAEQAGGKASSGEVPIMDLEPTELHERTPIYIGSTDMVDKVEEMLRKAKVGEALL